MLPYKGLHRIQVSGSCGWNRGKSMVVVVDNSEYSYTDIAKSVVEGFVAQHPSNALSWDWGESVFLHGRLHLSSVVSQTDRDRYLAYVSQYHEQYDGQFGQSKFNWADPCSPAWSAWYLHKEIGGTAGFQNLEMVLNFVRNEQPNAIGAFNHLGTSVRGYFAFLIGLERQSIWVDTLAMLATGMTIYGLDNNDDGLLNFALAQPQIYQKYLQSDSGIYFHAWNVARNVLLPSNNAPWLRGNGWIAANLVDMMDAIASSSTTTDNLASRYQEYSEIFKSQISGLKSKQLSTGLWDTVVDTPGYGYAETSGSALVGYSIAKGVNLGVLPPEDTKVAQRAFAGISVLLVPDGTNHAMTEISVGTNPSSAWGYSRIGRQTNLPYGVGAFAMLASELQKYDTASRNNRRRIKER